MTKQDLFLLPGTVKAVPPLLKIVHGARWLVLKLCASDPVEVATRMLEMRKWSHPTCCFCLTATLLWDLEIQKPQKLGFPQDHKLEPLTSHVLEGRADTFLQMQPPPKEMKEDLGSTLDSSLGQPTSSLD